MVLNARTSTVEKKIKTFLKNSINVLSAGVFIYVLLVILKLFHAYIKSQIISNNFILTLYNSGHFVL